MPSADLRLFCDCRQVYRALRPALEKEACARLLEALEARLQPPAPPLADLLVAADIIVTLEVRDFHRVQTAPAHCG